MTKRENLGCQKHCIVFQLGVIKTTKERKPKCFGWMICQIRPGKSERKSASYFSLHPHLSQRPLIPKPLWLVHRFNSIPQRIRCHITCLNVIWCYAIIFQSILKPLLVRYEAHLGSTEDVWQHALAHLWFSEFTQDTSSDGRGATDQTPTLTNHYHMSTDPWIHYFVAYYLQMLFICDCSLPAGIKFLYQSEVK